FKTPSALSASAIYRSSFSRKYPFLIYSIYFHRRFKYPDSTINRGRLKPPPPCGNSSPAGLSDRPWPCFGGTCLATIRSFKTHFRLFVGALNASPPRARTTPVVLKCTALSTSLRPTHH